MLRQQRPSGICLQSSSPGLCMGQKSASGGPKTRGRLTKEMPTVSYSLKIYLPKTASIFCLNRVFLLKAETYSHASTLLFIYDAVVRELAQDTVGPCLVPSSAPEGMTLLPYRASELPNWEWFCIWGFSSFEVFYSGAKCSRVIGLEQQQERA